MRGAALLGRLADEGVTLRIVGGKLRMAPAPSPTLLHDVAGAKAEMLDLLEQSADAAAEREARNVLPPLPTLGTPARDALETRHKAEVAAMLAVSCKRPPTFTCAVPSNPSPGAVCSACGGGVWWSVNRQGWSCRACHPPRRAGYARYTIPPL